MKRNKTFQRAAALLAAVSMALSMSVAAFAADFWLADGDITITVNENGSQTVNQSGQDTTVAEGEDVVIKGGSKTTTFGETDEDRPVADDTNEAELPEGKTDEQPAEDGEAETPVEEDKAEEPTEETTEEEPASEKEEGTDEVDEDAAENKQQPTEETVSEQEAATQEVSAPVTVDVDTQTANINDFLDNVITIINNYVDKVARVTLDNVKIDVAETGTESMPGVPAKAAVSIQGNGNVELELDGDNELYGGAARAGIEKNDETSTGKLTIKDDNSTAGSLKAQGNSGAAAIGGRANPDGAGSSSGNIEITGGTIEAVGTYGGGGMINPNDPDDPNNGAKLLSGAGIGGGAGANGHDITISGGTVKASAAGGAAAIGGGAYASATSDVVKTSSGTGSNITVSGDAQVTVEVTEKQSFYVGSGISAPHKGYWVGMSGGATIGNAGKILAEYSDNWLGEKFEESAAWSNGEEIQADISGMTSNGYIHHIIKTENKNATSVGDMFTITREWWERVGDTDKTENGDTTLHLHVEDALGNQLPYVSVREGSTLTFTAEADFARLHGAQAALEGLRADGVETIVFVTKQATSSHTVAELIAQGGAEFAVEHDGAAVNVLAGGSAEVLTCDLRDKK